MAEVSVPVDIDSGFGGYPIEFEAWLQDYIARFASLGARLLSVGEAFDLWMGVQRRQGLEAGEQRGDGLADEALRDFQRGVISAGELKERLRKCPGWDSVIADHVAKVCSGEVAAR
jgi:hypothetical protein